MALLKIMLLACYAAVAVSGALAATAKSEAGSGDDVATLVLDYQEWEPGSEPYASRALISAQAMRLDFGPDSGGYVLLDRSAGVVYSVQDEDRRILEIGPFDADKAALVQPPTLLLAEHGETDQQAPVIAGAQPVVTEYTANGELCTQTVSIPGLLPDALAAWRQFAVIMATQRATTVANTPPEYRQPCSLANDVYAPTRYLAHGLPISEHNRSGISRELRGFDENVSQSAQLFRLPEDYQHFHVGGDLQ